VLIGGADADTLLDDVVELATHATGWLPVCKTLLANLRMEADNWADQEMQFGRPLRILGAA
jgi:hypothetical protein